MKVEQRWMCDKAWVKEKGIATCGVFYLIDANLHVHICSLTPNLEAWPVQGYATFTSDAASELDEGETEQEMMSSEEGVSYFDLSVLRNPWQPVSLHLPEREEDEDRETYDARAAEHLREHLCGNPVWF